MKNETREAFTQLLSRIAELNGVRDVSQSFSVAPSVQQSLESHIQESSAFLQRVNIVGVDEMRGQRMGLEVGGPIAKRTDITKSDREPVDVIELDQVEFVCESTEFDTHISWAKLDAWAKFPDFQRRVRDMLVRQQALDRLTIGFNGTSAAAQTDSGANPLLQDVNKGWLQVLREHAPARVLGEGAAAGEVRVGPGGDYENIDALIFDVVGELIDPWHRGNPDINVIAGRELIADKYFQIASEHAGTPTEAVAMDVVMSNARFGGKAAARVPGMPENSLFITMPENLSIYWQRGSRRRFVIDNPKRKQIENYESSNEAYVIEDFGAACLVENIVFGSWA
ncbi:phage major capsid protein, P2 family [Halomonas icarae]|uniref:Phage major capsid protein, P2 family n=1 Tax=Halomonas icarae TaxID=2691040 RepID=A0A7X4VVY1_9GAMM|nr:phage major capsid protein, P2 family [Halomonas icarae]MDR5901030.1 phage major capsid protein, P2 family [Halomonas icarae]NAW11305.1 phage major capsid protein, P2 family [Halomonas icarae]